MKTRTKLIAGFAGVIILVLAAFHMTANIYADLRRQFNILEDDIFPSVLRMSEIEREAETLFHTATDYTITNSEETKEAAMSATGRLTEFGIQHFYREAQIGSQEKQAARELIQKISAFNTAINTIIRLQDQPANEPTLIGIQSSMVNPALSDLLESAREHKEYLLTKMTNAEEAIQKAETSGMQLLFSSAALATLAAMVLAFFIARSIVRPLEALRKGTEIIGQGNLDYTVGTNARDEIGQLSRAFDQMTKDLKTTTTSIDDLNREIAERQRAEEELRQSEEKYRAIFEQATDSIVLIDHNTNDILDFNDKAHQNLGYTREEFAKLKISDIDIVETAEESKERNEKILKEGVNNFETKHRTKTGEMRDILVNIRALNFAGKSLGLCMWHDITERKRTEEKLRESEEKYRAIFEQAANSVILVNLKESRIVDFNENAHKNLGYTREEFAKLKISDFDILETDEDVRKRTDEIRKKGEFSFETKHRTKSGEIRDIRVYGKNFIIRGEGFNMAIWHDITEEKRVAEALRESEEKYRAIFEQATDSIALIDTDNAQMVDFNTKAYENLGYTRKEFAKLRTHDIDAIETAEDIKKHKSEIKNERINSFETRHRTKKGEIRDAQVSIRSINFGGKNLILSVWHDITERKRAEEALRESEEFSTSLMENSAVPIMVVNDDTSMRYVNPAFEKLTGFKAKEVIGRKAPYPWWVKNVASGSVDGLKRDVHNGVSGLEKLFTKKTGERFWVAINSAPVKRDGVFHYSLENWLNITERKRADEALRESEEKYRAIFEQAINNIMLIDTETGAMVDFNDKAPESLGYTREEFAKLKMMDIDPDLEADNARGDRPRKWIKNRMEVFESKHRTKSGEIRDVWVSSTLIRLHGKNLALSISYDITDRKRAEAELHQALANLEQSSAQLAAMNKELEAFSYSVSHDLRTPLRTIDGFSQALLEDYQGKLDKEGQDYLQRVRSASQRMGTLIDDLLKLSRLSRSEMHQEKVNLSTLAEEVAAGLEQIEPQRQVEFVISQGLTVNGDRQLLRVVLENLLGNAWKFTSKQPQARIEVGMTGNGDKKEKTYFVRDNGAGFDMTYADKLFGAFQRLHDTTEFPGTGVGLATVQRIIHRHGGRTWAEGSVGKGATFYFTLN